MNGKQDSRTSNTFLLLAVFMYSNGSKGVMVVVVTRARAGRDDVLVSRGAWKAKMPRKLIG